MATKSKDKCIDLGFAEEQDAWLLTNRYFPSKIGGFPAWLDLQNIPDASDLACEYCESPCIFLCQIYAGSEKISAFHRTIYVFICKNGNCCSQNQSGNLKVLRSQLPLKNPYFPDSPPDESIELKAIESEVKLCHVCGCKGPMVCSKCKKAQYCGQLHQKLDWKVHKKLCGQAEEKKSTNEILFPEYEIIIEREDNQLENEVVESEKEADKRRIREYDEMVKKGQAGTSSDFTDKDLQEFAESKEDKAFGKFKKAIENYPEQVLRYNRHGSPLWISDNATLNSSKVPKCSYCNGKRSFEFQIMPQMLNELKEYALDWGVISVYTCENDCNTNGKYTTEFCYKQDIVKVDDDDNLVDAKMTEMVLNKNEKLEDAKVKITSNETMKQSTSTSKATSNKNKKGLNQSKSDKKAFQESDSWE